MELSYILVSIFCGLACFYAGTIYRRIAMYNQLQKVIHELEHHIINLLEEVKKENNKTSGLIGKFEEKELLEYSLNKAVETEDYPTAAFIRDVIKRNYGDNKEFE